MIYLGDDISTVYKDWMSYLRIESASLFTKKILRELYTREQLGRRSVSGSKKLLTPKGTHIRKQMTPQKSSIIESKIVFIHFTYLLFIYVFKKKFFQNVCVII